MVTHTPGTVLDRAVRRFKHRLSSGDGESGSLVLDILIGMAIFALVAIIAVSAVGQYRMRAYVQAAMSDAQAVANAVHASITDNAGDATATYPTGLLTAAQMAALEVTPTGRGAQQSAVTIIPDPTNPANFTVCVEHRGAYAEHASEQGLIASGNIARDGFRGCDATLPDDGSDGGDGGDGGDGSNDDDETAVAAPPPTGVDVTDPPSGSTEVTVSWNSVDGATDYSVNLDGNTTPAWTGPGTSTTLTDLPPGDHTVTVTAVVNGVPGQPSDPIEITITCDNDALRCAHVIEDGTPGVSTLSADYSNVGKTAETGEPDGGYGGLWWKVTANRATTQTIEVVQASDGSALFNYPKIRVWKANTSDVTALGTVYADNTGGGGLTPITRFNVEPGETFLVRVSTENTNSTSYRSKFRLKTTSGPANDSLAAAAAVGNPAPEASWTSEDFSNVFAGPQRGETIDPHGSMWWTFTAPRTATYKFETIQASDNSTMFTYPKIRAYETTSTDVTTIDSLAAEYANNRYSGGLTPVMRFAAVQGKTYKIKVSTENSHSTSYRTKYRVRLTAGPSNDSLNAAAVIPGDASGANVWTSEDVNNTLAGPEVGEAVDPHGSMWWTYTPTASGQRTVTVLAASDGTGHFTYPKIRVYNTTTGDVTTLGTPYAANTQWGGLNPYTPAFSVVAGQTYKIKVATEDSHSTSYRSKFRVRVS